ncbi:MAG: OsmC family protein [Ignavibacteriaceae bacterium]|nr:OsmC family protein [Ignavibacteriaceae bacterium]
MPVRKANAVWRGNLKEGSGNISTESGVLKNTTYNFVSRFETGNETNPEELLGAAHAACYSMALSGALSGAGFKVNSIFTEDKVLIEKLESGFTITKIEVNTTGDVEGIDNATFQKYATETKTGCPVSKALNVKEVVLIAKLK